MIIWGAVDKGSYNKSKKTLFTPISFSYQLRERKENVVPFGQNISAILSQKKWIIDENTELFDQQYITKNIEEISIYILGLIFFFRKEFDVSIGFLKKVLANYKAKPLLSDDDKIAIANILYMIDAVYRQRINKLELWPTSQNKDAHKKIAVHLVYELNQLGFISELLSSQIEFQMVIFRRPYNMQKKLALEHLLIRRRVLAFLFLRITKTTLLMVTNGSMRHS